MPDRSLRGLICPVPTQLQIRPLIIHFYTIIITYEVGSISFISDLYLRGTLFESLPRQVFRGFPQSLQANIVIVSQIKTAFSHIPPHLLYIVHFNATLSIL
jgi:hypothetical protein